MTAEEIEHLHRVASRLDELGSKVDRRGNCSPAELDKDYAELEDLEKEFHRGIVRYSGSGYIMQILDDYHLLQRSFLVGMGFPEGNRAKVHKEPQHRNIADAFRKRNPALVERAVHRHYRLVRNNLMLRFARNALVDHRDT